MAHQTAKPAKSPPAKPQAAPPSSTAPGVTPASKPNSGSKPNSLIGRSVTPVTAEMRRVMIAEAAYYLAEQRGFGADRELEDWLLAEKQVDAALSS